MIFKLDKGTGYMYCYSPEHALANKSGKVMEHIYVMSNHIGRKLKKNECVHHIDRDRTNNSLDNLLLMTNSEHAKLHLREDGRGISVDVECDNCGKVFCANKSDSRKYCSSKCSSESSKRFQVSKADLEALVWEKPTTQVAKIFGVSDVAVAKRCKKLGVKKPPRGYWRKLETGKVIKE